MAYEANRDRDEEKARNDYNNTKNVRNAADVAIATKNPYGVAVGGAVKVADKATGGKSSEAIGKALTKANQITPGGQKIQNLSNKASESGISDVAGKAASMKNSASQNAASQGEAKVGVNANVNAVPSKGAKSPTEGSQLVSKMPDKSQNYIASGQNTPQQVKVSGEGQNGSSPSSNEKESKSKERDSSNDDDYEEEGKGKGTGNILASAAVRTAVFILLPFFLVLLMFFAVFFVLTNVDSEYEDAFGISYTVGEETGNMEYTAISKEQQDFYDRIKEVKAEYQAKGKYIDALKLVAIYHTINANNQDITYKKIKKSTLENWADLMLDGNVYSEVVFKDNLIKKIFPKYLPDTTDKQKEELAEEVLDYIDRYYNLIGKESTRYSCATIGNCTYDIKGFSIPNSGNLVQPMQISNLKVRLMECSQPYGNGSDTKAIDQALVNFEDYVAGVAYAELGANASEEAYKAQMVVARSFALSRPAAMKGTAGKSLNQESGGWVLQISSCVSDQVFCNIDEGCSYMGGGTQGGIVRTGKIPGAVKTLEALPEDHPIRRAASATQGEVLVNEQGYIIASGYTSTDQNKWKQMASDGLDYKQILLQHYNQGNRNYGAKDIQKNSCSTEGNSNCISSGEFASWKQTDPQWANVPMGNSGRTIGQIGCLVTSIAMQIAKSGVDTPQIQPFNPGTFVQFINKHTGFAAGGNFIWEAATEAAPKFVYKGKISLAGMDRQTKLRRIQEIVTMPGVYAVAEVKGNTGQHWVAIDSVSGTTINMMDPSSDATDMWAEYNWSNTSMIVYYQVG